MVHACRSSATSVFAGQHASHAADIGELPAGPSLKRVLNAVDVQVE
jgi:hypothetical protein